MYSSHDVRASYSVALVSVKQSHSDIKRTKTNDFKYKARLQGWSTDFLSSYWTYSYYNENDSVSFVCDITVFGSVENTTLPKSTPLIHSYRIDVDKLLLSDSSSDLNVMVDKSSIPAHKFILQLRSPVFQTMLCSGMKESSSNQIITLDFDYEVVNEFIHFLYLDTCDPNVLTEHANSLLAIAHKYEVKGLIEVCENHLIRALTVDTAVEMMKLGGTIVLNCRDVQQVSSKSTAYRSS